MALFNALLMAAFHTLADFPAFVLCIYQFLLNLNIAVGILSVQVVIEEDDRNTLFL